MHVKSAATNPLRSSSSFYQTQFDLEFLWGTNGDYDYQPLDSLFSAMGGILPPESSTAHDVAMTAAGTGDWFVLTGFNLWNFRRQDCVDLANFVLEDMWDLTRNPAAARAYLHATPEPGPVAGAAIETASAAPAPPARVERPEGGRFPAPSAALASA